MIKKPELILTLKAKNPFLALFYTYPMYGFYFIFIVMFFDPNASIEKMIYFDFAMFLFFYSLAILSSIFFIYTSFKYKKIDIYDQNTIFIKNKTYKNISITIKSSYMRGLGATYINFISDDQIVGRFFLDKYGYEATDVPPDLIAELFNNKNINNKKTYFSDKMKFLKEETMQNKKLLFKGIGISLMIIIVPLIFILMLIFR